MWLAALRAIRRILLTVLVGGLLSATLLRFTPGLGAEESQLDPRWRAGSQEAIRSSRAAELDNLAAFYGKFLGGYFRGDLGMSRTLERPVSELLRERAGPTAASVGAGLALAWTLGMLVALAAVRFSSRLVEAGASVSAVCVQCIPAAVLGLLLLLVGGRGVLLATAGLALVVYSRVLPYARNVLRDVAGMPHVLLARAQGLGPWRILFRHVLDPALPEIVSLAGVSVSLALSVVIPLEALLDVPGVGQLVWQAALGRDVYLLLNVTVATSVVVLAANALADGVAACLRGVA